MSPDSVFRSSPAASNWQELYKSAILELDQNKVSHRIEDARRAIHHRAELLTNSSVNISLANERGELDDALHNLDSLEAVIRREKSA